jgi:uncharacterized protein YndB with AHSA1/START domain
MTQPSNGNRSDGGSWLVKAPPAAIYRVLLDPEAVVAWRPPKGMKAEVRCFEPRVSGKFRMSFIYLDRTISGKTLENADVFEGRFLDLTPNRRVVERIEFESLDPAFAGSMTVTTTLDAAAGGTRVTILCENVPSGISRADHEAGIASTLTNLVAFVE